MRLLTVGENEAGQRLLRLLEKYMDKAPKSFFYKMLRKKNITLNGKKAQGNEILKTLREMEVIDTQYNGYIPAYKRTQITDELHQLFGFRTDYEIIGKKKMRNIIKNTKIR